MHVLVRQHGLGVLTAGQPAVVDDVLGHGVTSAVITRYVRLAVRQRSRSTRLDAEAGQSGADLMIVRHVEFPRRSGSWRKNGLLRSLIEVVVSLGGPGAAGREGSLIVLGHQSVVILSPAQAGVVHPTYSKNIS